ncbi:Lipase 8 [Candida viswanathii]|uniref:Lipase 8 n=1 Tax=Candida viswanathii TaxID=5486 RepID=A0A367XQE2_9ASCO|nr:Lipase 8 [Candida viswanathii]
MLSFLLLLLPLAWSYDVDAAAPGTLVSHINQKFANFQNLQNSWVFNVVSQDSFGTPNVITTSILQPTNANASRVVSYQIPEDAATIECAPSVNLLGNNFTGVSDINLLLSQGYYVVIPDYEGPKLAFLAGHQAGHAILDSLRAVLLSKNITGIENTALVNLWGFSGGSFASGWAASLQPTYAPELSANLVGVAVGGFVTDIKAVVKHIDGSPFSGLIAAGIAGLMNEYPDFATQLTSHSTYTGFSEFSKQCSMDTVLKFPFTQFFSGPFRIFPDGWSLADAEPAKTVIASNSLLKQTDPEIMPRVPVFIYHGSVDEIVPVQNSNDIYAKWCGAGISSLEFAEDLTSGHLMEGSIGTPAAIAWMTNRFKGLSVVEGCTHQKRLNNLFYPGIDPVVVQAVKFEIEMRFGGLGQDIKQDKPSLEELQAYASKNDAVI